jgi:hypothetical protein
MTGVVWPEAKETINVKIEIVIHILKNEDKVLIITESFLKLVIYEMEGWFGNGIFRILFPVEK